MESGERRERMEGSCWVLCFVLHVAVCLLLLCGVWCVLFVVVCVVVS